MSGNLKSKDTPGNNKRRQYVEMARLRWKLVEHTRQNWTFLSLAVVAAGAWLLTRGHPALQGTPISWAAGAVALLFAVGWAMGHHSLLRTQRRLTALEEKTGCRQRYPLLRLFMDPS